MNSSLKWCSCCQSQKQVGDFYTYTRKLPGAKSRKDLTGYCKNCIAEKGKQQRANIAESDGSISEQKFIERALVNYTRANNKQPNDPNDRLTWEYLMNLWKSQNGLCAISAIPLKPRKGRINPYTPSLDRIDNKAGYAKGNVRWVLLGVNSLKGVGTDEDVRYIAENITLNRAKITKEDA
jgi:hypothetical protein